MITPIFFLFTLSFLGNASPLALTDDPQPHPTVSTDSGALQEQVELLASGMQWTEGPVWVNEGQYVLFSDPALNTIYKWDPNDGHRPFIHPSGYAGPEKYSDEPGTNGLLINLQGELIACDHGNRRIVTIDLATQEKTTLVDKWDGKRFNSPNDICQHPNGDYYFTDPPYGLPDREKDTLNREIVENGVYRLKTDGTVEQVISDLTRPNGIALSPDARTLYVAISDGKQPYIMSYTLDNGQIVGDGEIYFNFKSQFPGEPMTADGIKVDAMGNVFAAAGDGVILISPQGNVISRIRTGHRTANCAFSDDGYLYITATAHLFRIPLSKIPGYTPGGG